MGKLNILKANWIGKVGETVGAKWKNKKVIRTYSIPSNPRTDAQMTVRSVFKSETQFVSLFADQIKYLSSLDVRGMSVRNAILKLNKEQVATGTFDKATLLVNKGGLPNATSFTLGALAVGNSFTATWTKPVATNLTEKAKLVVVAVDEANNIGVAGSALLSAETITVQMPLQSGANVDVYYYVIDYRGSARVGSASKYTSGTVS